jgi:electron transport complex protein RnfG
MNIGKNMLISASLLGIFAIVGTAMVAYTNDTTFERVEANKRDFTLKKLHEIISPKAHDNDLERDTIRVTDPLLGSKQPMSVYRARKNGKPIAAIIQSIAPDGYSGNIEMLRPPAWAITLISASPTGSCNSTTVHWKIQVQRIGK